MVAKASRVAVGPTYDLRSRVSDPPLLEGALEAHIPGIHVNGHLNVDWAPNGRVCGIELFVTRRCHSRVPAEPTNSCCCWPLRWEGQADPDKLMGKFRILARSIAVTCPASPTPLLHHPNPYLLRPPTGAIGSGSNHTLRITV